MALRLLALLSLLVSSGWARDLHEKRVLLVELELPANDLDAVVVSRSEEEERLFPAYLPLEVHADGERVASLMLQRSADLDEGFPIESADGEFETIPAQRMTDAAMYRDSSSRAVFGVKRDENGNREYEGSFDVDGKSYFMSRQDDNKRSDKEYKLTRMERRAFSRDALKLSPEKLERINPKFSTRANNYVVEVGVLVDYTEYKYWLDQEGSQSKALNMVNYKMTYMLNAMREAYKTVTGITITPYFTKLSVNTNAAGSIIEDRFNQYVNSSNYYLDKWAKQAPKNGMAAGSDVDIGMWWAKYDICGDEDCGVIGLAWTEAVCDPNYGYNIIEDTGFDTWSTAAHELAHNLGAGHDGDEGNDCDPKDYYVMTPSTGWPPVGSDHTGYDFSPCSIKEMTNTLASKNCLSNGAKDGFKKVNLGLPGAVFSVDYQCQFLHGDGSAECPVDVEPTRCRDGIWCTDPATPGRCIQRPKLPWEGTPCGGGKHCFNAKCTN